MTHPLVGVTREFAPKFAERAAKGDKSRTYGWSNINTLAESGQRPEHTGRKTSLSGAKR